MTPATAWLDLEEEDEEVEVSLVESVDIEVRAKDIGACSYATAREQIDLFFTDKLLHCGGKIPKRLLHDDTRVKKVVNLSIKKAIRRAYIALKHTVSEQELMDAKRLGDSTSDIRLVNETLKLLAQSGVPRQFAGRYVTDVP